MTAGYVWYFGTLTDGRITGRLPIVSSRWQEVMDDAGSMSVLTTLADERVQKLNLFTAAEPCRTWLGRAYVDKTGRETWLDAGPVWAHGWDQKSKQLTLTAAGAWSYYDHRSVLQVLTSGQTPADSLTTWTDTAANTAKKLVQLAHDHTNGSLPVVLPDDDTGVTLARNYPGWTLPSTGQTLRDLTQENGGPEIQFVPRRRTDDPRYIEWVMRVGTSGQPLLSQAGADWLWDDRVPKSPVSSLQIRRDGTNMAASAWVQGPGSGAGTMFGGAASTVLTDAGFPLLDYAGQDTTATSQQVLDWDAQAALARSSRPLTTWGVTVHRDRFPTVAQTRVGDWAKFKVRSGGYLPPGSYRTRITSRAGDQGTRVTLGLAPTVAGEV